TTMTGDTTVPGNPNLKLLPGAVGDPFPNGDGSTFVTYDATNGIRPLDLVTEFTPTLATGTSPNNVNLTTAVTGLNAATTVNSLRLDSGGSVAGTGTLALTSGNILAIADSTL